MTSAADISAAINASLASAVKASEKPAAKRKRKTRASEDGKSWCTVTLYFRANGTEIPVDLVIKATDAKDATWKAIEKHARLGGISPDRVYQSEVRWGYVPKEGMWDHPEIMNFQGELPSPPSVLVTDPRAIPVFFPDLRSSQSTPSQSIPSKSIPSKSIPVQKGYQS